MTKLAQTGSSQAKTGAQGKKQAIALVVDHFLDNEPAFLKSFSELVKPASSRLSLIHALDETHSEKPFTRSEEDRFPMFAQAITASTLYTSLRIIISKLRAL